MKGPGDLHEIAVIRLGESTTLDLTIQNLATQLDRCRVLLDAESLPDLVTSATGADVRQPVATRLRRWRRDDLHRLRVFELAGQTGDAPVDARTLTMEADLRVNREGEVDRRRPLGQLDDVAGRSEDENFVLIQIELEELEKLVGSFCIELQLEHLTEPLQRAIELVGAARIFLESPVSRDSVLGGAVHLAGADLNLKELPIGPEDSRMQRLVAVRLWLRDVVLDALLQRRELVVDHAEGVVTVGNGIDEDADRQQIVDLLVRFVPLLHLLLDRPEVLRTTGHIYVHDLRFTQVLFERILEQRDGFLSVGASSRYLLGERLVLRGLEMLECEIFELPTNARHSEAVREWCVQVARLGRNPLLSVGRKEFQRAHVVQTVGKLDQDDAGILGDRQQQLAIILDLAVLGRVERQMADLGQAIDDLGDLLAELRFDVVDGYCGVFDDVVDQPAGNGGRIELQIDEDLGDFDAVRDVPVAGETLLALVRALAEPIGAPE